MLVCKHLEFDVPGFPDKFFNENIRVIECLGCFIGGKGEHSFHILFLLYHTHSSSATTGGGFQDDGKTYLPGYFDGLFGIADRSLTATKKGYIVGLGQFLSDGFISHAVDGIVGRADENDTLFFATPGEVGIFSQESVSGVD